MRVEELEAMCRSLLHNAAAREWVAARAQADSATPEYHTGFAAGYQAGELAALALVVASLSGESATSLVEEARSQASVEAAFPFELHVEPAWDEAAPDEAAPDEAAPDEAA